MTNKKVTILELRMTKIFKLSIIFFRNYKRTLTSLASGMKKKSNNFNSPITKKMKTVIDHLHLKKLFITNF